MKKGIFFIPVYKKSENYIILSELRIKLFKEKNLIERGFLWRTYY